MYVFILLVLFVLFVYLSYVLHFIEYYKDFWAVVYWILVYN